MTFVEMLEHLRNGKLTRRAIWSNFWRIRINTGGSVIYNHDERGDDSACYRLHDDDLRALDWEVCDQ